ncbi:MAG: glycoside hydrolase family 127 protein [Bacteroidales bacterium]|nr:glycoside hydrolase family 127 protein [Bacteroidales bacterium]
MKLLFLIPIGILLLPGCTGKNTPISQDSNEIKALDIRNVTLRGGFWEPLVRRNIDVTIPYAFRMCEETGRIENFSVAAGNSTKKHEGERYNDTDVFKIIEGAAGSLRIKPDPDLERYTDSLITLIGQAQEEDGYLFTARSADPDHPSPGAGSDRWTDIWVSHELYNAGHLYEAAIAYYLATGKDALLNIARKNADLVCEVFGWGKKEAAPGHQEIEIGLIKLYQLTGDKKYLEQARFFLDVRGKQQEYKEHPEGTRFAIYNNKPYLQQHAPILEQPEAIGHAVRATYMYTAMTDLARYLPGCPAYHEKSEELWKDVTGKKLYITGGVGARHEGEAFGEAYALPNKEAYNETCAAIGNVLWNQSLFLSTGNSKYMDVLERTLYNGLISGISEDGMHFFYPNPLASDGTYQRSPWFGVACCPGNVCRFMARVPDLIYATTNAGVYVNLFVASEAKIGLGGTTVKLEQQTEYPWSGSVSILVSPEKKADFTIKVRIPSWLGTAPFEGDLYHYMDQTAYQPEISLNGKPVKYTVEKGYACIKRSWQKNDRLEVSLPMPVRKVLANAKVAADSGRIAFERGPIVYCLEEVDNGKISKLELPADVPSEYQYNETLLGGTGTLKVEQNDKILTAIPYFLWANRSPGEMAVWIKVNSR